MSLPHLGGGKRGRMGARPEKVEKVKELSERFRLAKGAVFAHPAVKADGSYSQRFTIRRLLRRVQTFFLKATATAPQRDLAATACKATFGVPCIGATASGFTAVSSARRIVVPKKR